MRLDGNYPSGMKEYLEYYGWHFSKKMCEWAISNMYKVVNGRKEYIKAYTKDELTSLLQKYGITLQNNVAYDAVYVAAMCKADFFGSSVPDEAHLALYVKNVIDDADAYEGMVFTRFYADCIGSGTPIMWEDLI